MEYWVEMDVVQRIDLISVLEFRSELYYDIVYNNA